MRSLAYPFHVDINNITAKIIKANLAIKETFGCRPAWPEGVRARICRLMQALDLSLSCSFPRSPFIICLLLAQGMNKTEAEVRLAFLVLIKSSRRCLMRFVENFYLKKKVTVANSASREGKSPHQS